MKNFEKPVDLSGFKIEEDIIFVKEFI